MNGLSMLHTIVFYLLLILQNCNLFHYTHYLTRARLHIEPGARSWKGSPGVCCLPFRELSVLVQSIYYYIDRPRVPEYVKGTRGYKIQQELALQTTGCPLKQWSPYSVCRHHLASPQPLYVHC